MQEIITVIYRRQQNGNNAAGVLVLLSTNSDTALTDGQVSQLRNHFVFYAYCLWYMERGQTSLRDYLAAGRGTYGHVTGTHLQLDRDFFTRPGEGVTDAVLARPDRDHIIINHMERLLRVVLEMKKRQTT